MVGACGAEQVDSFVGHRDIFFCLLVERRLYRGELLVESVSLICAQFVFTNIDLDLPYFLVPWFVGIKRFFVLALVDLFGVDYLIAEERNGVKVLAESESSNADRVNLVGYGHVL